jgi:hypothetical protein
VKSRFPAVAKSKEYSGKEISEIIRKRPRTKKVPKMYKAGSVSWAVYSSAAVTFGFIFLGYASVNL